MRKISTCEYEVLADFDQNQFQNVNFGRVFWTIKKEFGNVINIKVVHLHVMNKSVKPVYLESNCKKS
jgi:hypothetical protein